MNHDFSRPAQRQELVTPSNTNDNVVECRALFAITSGNVSITLVSDPKSADPIAYPVVAGDILPVFARRVWLTDTTATVIAWY